MPLSLGGSPAALLWCMLLLSAVYLGSWRRHWAGRAISCMLVVAVGTLDVVMFGCPMAQISAEPAPRRIFAPLCPVQSPAPPTLARPYPSGDWVFNFQTGAHEHDRPGEVFQSFCPEGQPDRRCRAPFSGDTPK
ncbi:hypothetical protein V8E54_007560 [Elaphomyces granulatus]